MSGESTTIEDFVLISEIGQELSNFFKGIQTKNIRKAKSAHYLAKALNTNFSILSLIPGAKPYSCDKLVYQDNSSIYSLLRNQLEICNIYWYLIDEEYDENLFDLKLNLLEYHDTISCQKIYNTLFKSEDNEEYYHERATSQLLNVESNSKFSALNNNQKQQIKKGNVSTLSTQFEIAEKRCINVNQFKAFYKLFSTHTHSSPTAIKNIVVSTFESSLKFENIFFELSLIYALSFIAEMILSVGKLWEINFRKIDSEQLLIYYSKQMKL